MADEPRSFEDDATLYVLGRFNAAERREFEARLAQSPELRSLVRDLEAGTVALALAMPQREPPAQLWERIEAAVAEEANRQTPAQKFWAVFRKQSGWWAAAACLVGWFLYALHVNDVHSSVNSSAGSGNVPATGSQADLASTESVNLETAHAASPPATSSATNSHLRVSPLARTGEIAALRRQVQDLESQMAQMSQTLTQQMLLPTSGRFTLFRMTPPSVKDGAAQSLPPSPEAQRALLLALARELGWLRAHGAEGDAQSGTGESIAGVDFVDLPSSNDESSHHAATNAVAQSLPSTGNETNASNGTITGFISATNTVMVFDPSLAASGSGSSPYTVWTIDQYGNPQPLGTFGVGNNPVVVTIPVGSFNNNTAGGGGVINFTVTSGSDSSSFNQGNVIGQFPPH